MWLRFNRFTPLAMALGGGIGVALATIGLAVILLSLYGYFTMLDLAMPGVRVGDVNLGGTPQAEIVRRLDGSWNGEKVLTLSDGVGTWSASPLELGITLDAQATAARVMAVGREKGLIGNILEMVDGLSGGYQVSPVVAVDALAARAGLETWAPIVAVEPQNATIRIEGGQVEAVPGVPGRTLNIEATLAALIQNPAGALASGTLELAIDPVPPAIADAGPAAEQARRWLAAPLPITIYDPITDERIEQQVAPEVVSSWLAVEQTEAGPTVVVDDDRLAAYLEELSATLASPRYLDPGRSAGPLTEALHSGQPAMLLVSHHPTTYTVQQGDTLIRISWKVGVPYWRIREANPGIEENALSAGQTITIPSKDDLLPLPVVLNKRMVVDISEQRLWVYENGELVRNFVISTGIDRSPTQPGVFQIQTHENPAYASAWDLWMPHFMGIYEAWPGFMNGFHGLPTLSSGVTLWRDILGSPASYGCIILDLPDGEWLYNWAEEGVVVEIRE